MLPFHSPPLSVIELCRFMPEQCMQQHRSWNKTHETKLPSCTQPRALWHEKTLQGLGVTNGLTL